MLLNIVRSIRFSLLLFLFLASQAMAAESEYVLGAGDIIRITVFQNPDLTVETRVSENGTITYPLLGTVAVGGTSASQAEKQIASLLRSGGFVLQPQVNILTTQVRGNQVAVLGQVNRPGRFPLENVNTRLSDVLALAGGIAPTGSDVIVLSGERDGKSIHLDVDVPAMYLNKGGAQDVVVRSGDVIYVHRAPQFYIYGEVQRPGAYRVERSMNVMQALAQGGGVTLRGSQRGLRINRRDAEGKVERISPEMDDPIQPDDVIYVRESLF